MTLTAKICFKYLFVFALVMHSCTTDKNIKKEDVRFCINPVTKSIKDLNYKYLITTVNFINDSLVELLVIDSTGFDNNGRKVFTIPIGGGFWGHISSCFRYNSNGIPVQKCEEYSYTSRLLYCVDSNVIKQYWYRINDCLCFDIDTNKGKAFPVPDNNNYEYITYYTIDENGIIINRSDTIYSIDYIYDANSELCLQEDVVLKIYKNTKFKTKYLYKNGQLTQIVRYENGELERRTYIGSNSLKDSTYVFDDSMKVTHKIYYEYFK